MGRRGKGWRSSGSGGPRGSARSCCRGGGPRRRAERRGPRLKVEKAEGDGGKRLRASREEKKNAPLAPLTEKEERAAFDRLDPLFCQRLLGKEASMVSNPSRERERFKRGRKTRESGRFKSCNSFQSRRQPTLFSSFLALLCAARLACDEPRGARRVLTRDVAEATRAARRSETRREGLISLLFLRCSF